MKIYVSNLAYGLTDADLRAAFAPFGEAESVRIIYDQVTGRSRGFGFVEMTVRGEAEAAIAALGQTELQGRKMRLSEAEGRPQKPMQDPVKKSPTEDSSQ